MSFNYSINAGKVVTTNSNSEINVSLNYWNRITGNQVNVDEATNLFTNIGTMANAYKNLYGAEFAISDGYKFFENNEMSSILDVSELNYSYTEELSRVDVYKNVFMQKLGYSGVLEGFSADSGIFNADEGTDYTFNLYQRDVAGDLILDADKKKQVSNSIDLSDLDLSDTKPLKDLYLQLEEEANKLKETLYQDELAYGGYPEIEYTEVEAQNELLQQQLNMEMKNFQTLLEDMYNVMKVNAGGHDQDNGNTEDAMRFKEQEAATAATLAGKLVLDYAEKYYNHNVKPQADEYIFAQAFMDDNRVAGINTVLNGYLGSYASISTLQSIQFETTLQKNEIKPAAGQTFTTATDLLNNENAYEMRQQMSSEINSLLKDALIDKAFSSKAEDLKNQQEILEGRIKTYIKAASKKGNGWEATLRGQLSAASVSYSTINNIVENIKKDADYYTDNSDIENAIKKAYSELYLDTDKVKTAIQGLHTNLTGDNLDKVVAALKEDWNTLFNSSGELNWGSLQSKYTELIVNDASTMISVEQKLEAIYSEVTDNREAIKSELLKKLAMTSLDPNMTITVAGNSKNVIDDIVDQIKDKTAANNKDDYYDSDGNPTEKLKKLLGYSTSTTTVSTNKDTIKTLIKNAIKAHNLGSLNDANVSKLKTELASTNLLTAAEINKIVEDIQNYHYSDIEYKLEYTSGAALEKAVEDLTSATANTLSDAVIKKITTQVLATYEAYDQSANKNNFDFSSLQTIISSILTDEYSSDLDTDKRNSILGNIKTETKWSNFVNALKNNLCARDTDKSTDKNLDEVDSMISLLSGKDDSVENKNMSDLMDMLNTQSYFNRQVMDGLEMSDEEKLLYTSIKTNMSSDDVIKLLGNVSTYKGYFNNIAGLLAGTISSNNIKTDIYNSLCNIGIDSSEVNNILEKYFDGNQFKELATDVDINYVFDLTEKNAVDIKGVGNENILNSNIGALNDSQLAEIGDNTTDYITWMVRDFFGVGGITTDIKDTSYCFQEADPIAAKLVQSAENLVKLNMEKQKYNVEAAVNNQIRAEYEARLGAMQAINQILTCPDPTSENDPYNVEINGEKYILGKDINDDKVINSIVEIFGIDDTKDNVFQSLKALDDNQDGYVSKEELSAHNIIFNKVDNEGKLTAETFDISKIQGISLSELENADGTNNVFGLFKLDLESSRADGTVTFENDAYFDNLFSKNDVMTSMEEIDVETSQEVMPEVIETEENVFEKKYSFNLGEDNKNIFEKLFDELCWKMGINNISEVQKDKIIDSIDEDLDIDIVEAQMQQKLDTFNLSA